MLIKTVSRRRVSRPNKGLNPFYPYGSGLKAAFA